MEYEILTENSIRVIFWISKGLILRLANTEEVLQRLLSLLSDDNHGLVAGHGFGLLLAPDEVLSKDNDATIRLLTKQKVFSFCIPKIAAHFRRVEISTKPNYLIALSGILKYMPTEIVVTEIETLLPLLLQSLDLKDQDVKAATIESVIFISQESSAAIEGHIPSLIQRLLKSAEKPNENVPVRLISSDVCDYELNSLIDVWHRGSESMPFGAYDCSHVRSKIALCYHTDTRSLEPYGTFLTIRNETSGKRPWCVERRG